MRKIWTEHLELFDREKEANIEYDDVKFNDMKVKISASELVVIKLYFCYKCFTLM